jgi:hypothetical protein
MYYSIIISKSKIKKPISINFNVLKTNNISESQKIKAREVRILFYKSGFKKNYQFRSKKEREKKNNLFRLE